MPSDIPADRTERSSTGSERPTIMRNVIKHPDGHSAGIAVAHVENAPPHETEYRVEQLWPDGKAEPVYIGDEEDALRLVEELTKVIRREQ